MLQEILAYHDHMKSTGNLAERKGTQRSNETYEIINYLSLNYISEFVNNTPEFTQILDEVKTRSADPYTSSNIIMNKLKEIIEKE